MHLQVPPGKTLVVKFADRAIASRNAAASAQQAAYPQANGNGNGSFYM
jgi:phage terminase small subunit